MGLLGSTKEKILKEIGKGPIHGYELANKLGISLSSACEQIKNLRDGGFVEVGEEDRKKIYPFTDKGKHLLKALE